MMNLENHQFLSPRRTGQALGNRNFHKILYEFAAEEGELSNMNLGNRKA